MPLTDAKLRNLKTAPKPQRISDGAGLFIEARPTGRKLWRMAYRFGGKQKLLALGAYPETSLARARERALAARKLLADGIDPAAARKAEKAAETFGEVVEAWYQLRLPTWGKRHAKRVRTFLDTDLKPLADRKAREITTADLLACLRVIEKRGALHQISKAQGVCRDVLAYAVGIGAAENNPARDLPRDVLARATTTHHAALTDPQAVGALLRSIRGYQNRVVGIGLEVLAHLFCRPGELRLATWVEFDLDACLWLIPAGRMKMREAHAVPLSGQAVALLRELHQYTGAGDYLLAGARRGRPISDATFCAALRAMGYGADVHQPHGFRASARTLLSERLHEPTDWIERQLAHSVPGALRGAYARGQFLQQRTGMMQRWSDYLDKLAAGAEVIAMRA
jgi:integrase